MRAFAQMVRNKLQSKTSQGFTIIEVMIVLAIAGLILLIVFLAVPALQRNQRNTARKKDVSRVAAVVIEYVTSTANVNAGLSSSDDNTIVGLAGTLSQYNLTTGGSGNFSIYAGTAAPSPATITDISSMRVNYGWKCDPAGNGTVVIGSKRQIAVQYSNEKADGSTTPLCVDY